MTTKSGILIKETLNKFGDFAWVRYNDPEFSQANNMEIRPYFIAWRYKNPDSKIEKAITEAINSFRGNVEWSIELKPFGNPNWLIEPKKSYLITNEYDFALVANNDIKALAEHIDKYVTNKLVQDKVMPE
jgi:hypothetical protein